MYSTVLIVGAGESGLCMAAQLKRRYNLTDFVIYERHGDVGGTWYANTYPGVACDVPALCYSYSFARNPEWTVFYPHGKELHDYFTKFTDSHALRPHITFHTEVVSARWLESRQVWSVRLRRRPVPAWEATLPNQDPQKLQSQSAGEEGDTWTHECKLLFTAVGGLVEPQELEVKGKDSFEGSIFHSAYWDHSIDIKDKNVVIIGNGCTAAQIVPAIEPQVKSLTQIIRSPHWLLPRPTFPGVDSAGYEKWSPFFFKYIPGLQNMARALMFTSIEAGWLAFRNDKRGEKLRQAQERKSLAHIKKHAPERYWNILIPTFPIGFKRRIYDDTYLPSLNSPKITLLKDEISRLTPTALHTASGEEIQSDVIILATGYKTNDWIAPLEIVGRNNQTLSEHWKQAGGPGAYNSTAVNGFPNMFMIVGPNSVTGHTSVILASENMCRYALNICEPVIKGEASEVEIKREAEVSYGEWVRRELKKTVFDNKEFRSWYVREDGWNASTYPKSQVHFTYRSYFPVYKDWIVKKTALGEWKAKVRRLLVLFLIFGAGASHLLLKSRGLGWREARTIAALVVATGLERLSGVVKALH